MTTTRSIIESLLFASDAPLTVERIQKVLPETDKNVIRAALEHIKAEFDRREGGVLLREVAGGYQFRTPEQHKKWVQRLVQPGAGRLSKAALETLAVIAYRQPVMRSEIEHIRGVNAGATIRLLLDRKLVRILGRREIPGRPLVYGTTRKFLETFDLKDLKDLPTPTDVDDGRGPSKPGEQALPLHTETDPGTDSKNNT